MTQANAPGPRSTAGDRPVDAPPLPRNRSDASPRPRPMLRALPWAIVLGLAGGLGVALFLHRILTPVFSSTAIVQVSPGPAETPSQVETYLQAQMNRIASPRTMDLALQSPVWKSAVGDDPDAAMRLRKNLVIVHQTNSNLVLIKMADGDPRVAKAGVTAVAEAYARQDAEQRSELRLKRYELLQQRKAEVAARMRNTRDARLKAGLQDEMDQIDRRGEATAATEADPGPGRIIAAGGDPIPAAGALPRGLLSLAGGGVVFLLIFGLILLAALARPAQPAV